MDLPLEFEHAYELAKVKEEQNHLARVSLLPLSWPDVITQIFNVFFAYCEQARNAYRAGKWTLAELSQAAEDEWPRICDSFLLREHGARSEEQKSAARASLWKVMTT